jgi:hypothetical protein
MNNTRNLWLEIAQLGEAILGDNLIGFQVGNEPDLYGWYVHVTTKLFHRTECTRLCLGMARVAAQPLTAQKITSTNSVW